MASPTAPSWAEWRLNPPTAIPPTSNTLAHHESMPKLPVPELKQTAEKLLRSASALAKEPQELKALEKKVDEFIKPGGLGERLQSKLKERAGQKDMINWIAEWWDTQAYMAYRESVVINVSYYYGFKRLPQSSAASGDPYQEKANPAFVAASLVGTILDFRGLLVDGKIAPDTAGGTKLDMESYKWMFNACRIPSKPADYAIKISETDPAGSHFVVVRNNQFYKLPLFSKDGTAWSLESLEKVFEDIYARTNSAEPVGIITGAHRDLWTDASIPVELVTRLANQTLQARAHLLALSQNNVETLSAIEAASFVLCLDEVKPTTALSADGQQGVEGVIDFSRKLMHGNGQNRWYDKPLQWVVFDSGEAGFIGEHSCMDGTPTAAVNDYVGQRLSKRDFPAGGVHATIEAQPLGFDIDDTYKSHMSEAEKAYKQATSEEAMGYVHYARYGKEGIKKQKCSPDGWVQMIMQLAYALTFPDRPTTGTYEAAMTRKFALGRTETVRIASPASKAFVLAMLPNSGADQTEKRRLFMDALKQHGADMKDASAAQGVDRHLFGLKMLAAEAGEQSDLFKDDLFVRSGTWQMSTSAIYSKHFRAYGWGQVVPDGFGLPYSIHDNYLVWTVTSKTSQKNQGFTENLRKAADMLMDMSEAALHEVSHAPKSKL